MGTDHTSIDWKRIVVRLACVILGGVAAWLAQPYIHGNNTAIGIIVSVFAILAGFLVTIMTQLGDPNLYRGGTWKSEVVKKNKVYLRLVEHKWLFILYLSVLGLIFLATLVLDKEPENLFVIWIERLYILLATVAFILSLALPDRLMNLQMARFEEKIAAREKQADEAPQSKERKREN